MGGGGHGWERSLKQREWWAGDIAQSPGVFWLTGVGGQFVIAVRSSAAAEKERTLSLSLSLPVELAL
jgi:hypothetical protein